MAAWNATTATTCSMPEPSYHIEPLVVALVTGGSSAMVMPSLRNQQCYSQLHGLRLHYVQHDFVKGSGLHGMFNKMFSVKHALQAVPMGSWVLWVDQDVFFTNMSARVVDVIRRAHLARLGPSRGGGPAPRRR